MVYWIASGDRKNWEVVKKKQIWGVPKRNKNLLSRVKPGDAVLMYVRSEMHGKEVYPSAFMGSYKVIETYEDSNPVFTPPPQMGGEVFPYRFKLQPIQVFSTPVDVKPLINNLKFVTNKTMWSGHFRQAMREIPEEDYQMIMKIGKGSN